MEGKETYSKFLNKEKSKLIKEYGLEEGLQRWEQLQKLKWVQNKFNLKIRPS